VIYTAMTGVLNVPNDDRFMVITEHDQADLVISPEHLGIGHTADVVLIQVTRNEGRTVPVKWDFYRAMADGLHERTGLRREDGTDHPTEPDHRVDGQQYLRDLVFGRAHRQRLAAAPFQADLYRRDAKAASASP
jgi:hypothetical protein